MSTVERFPSRVKAFSHPKTVLPYSCLLRDLGVSVVQLPFLLEWVRGYATRSDDLSLAAHRRMFDAFGGAKKEITTDDAEL